MNNEPINKIPILVSSCLLGNNLKYNGGNNLINHLKEDLIDFLIIPVCPEVIGGLKIPRNPAEIVNNKVITTNKKDVTIEYEKGANGALYFVNKYHIKYAVLKSKSPSCGYQEIYDGSFSHTVINGNGITSKTLLQAGVEIYNETNYHLLLKKIKNINY